MLMQVPKDFSYRNIPATLNVSNSIFAVQSDGIARTYNVQPGWCGCGHRAAFLVPVRYCWSMKCGSGGRGNVDAIFGEEDGDGEGDEDADEDAVDVKDEIDDHENDGGADIGAAEEAVAAGGAVSVGWENGVASAVASEISSTSCPRAFCHSLSALEPSAVCHSTSEADHSSLF